jgi:hypothetical protein
MFIYSFEAKRRPKFVPKEGSVSSDFSRRRFVEEGLIRGQSASLSLSVQSGRVWTVSSVKQCFLSAAVSSRSAVCSVVFERVSELKGIGGKAFWKTGLKSIVVPSSVVILAKSSFCECGSLGFVIFESGSQLERIEEPAFDRSGLRSIIIPSSAIVLAKSSFYCCKSLDYVLFEHGSRLERIEESAFDRSGLEWIVIPSSVVLLGKTSFLACERLEFVMFESGSRLERIEEGAFQLSGLKSIEIPPSVTFVDGSAFLNLSVHSISMPPGRGLLRLRELLLEAIDLSMICRYFGSCNSVVIPLSVVVLGESSFHGCHSLESVFFEPESRLERIGAYAFSGSGLKSIVIPSSVVVLGESSFHLCQSLGSVVFEDASRLERIEESAFSSSGLKSIAIPPSVAFIGYLVFDRVSPNSISVSRGNGT